MNTKELTMYRLKEAYKGTHAKHINEAYKELVKKYEEATPEQWQSLSPDKAWEYDHARSLLIRAEHLEREHNLNKIKQSKNIVIKLERHQNAPELNKAHIYRIANKKEKKVGRKATPQATTIGDALKQLTNTEILNLCLYA